MGGALMPQLYQDDPTDRCESCETELAEGERDLCAGCLADHLRRLLASESWCRDPRRGAHPHPLTRVLERDRVRAELDALEEHLGDDRTEEEQERDADLLALDMHIAAGAAVRR